MDKKVDEGVSKKEIIYDDKEDLEIKKIAHLKDNSSKFLLLFLIILFGIMLVSSVIFINSYYKNEENSSVGETIEISNYKNNVLITNNGEISENVKNLSFENKNELIVEKVNTIELSTNDNATEDGTINFDIKYEIIENDFIRNEYASNDSGVLVRFSYSYDNEEWTYVNNVISNGNSTISPLMGNVYDIAGVISNLKIATNFELSSKPGETKIMYWRSETIFKNNREEDINNNLKANFKVEYKNND